MEDCVHVCPLSRVGLSSIPWTVARQAPLSMGFPRQEHWNGVPFPSPGDLSNPGKEAGSAALQADSLPFEPLGKPRNTWKSSNMPHYKQSPTRSGTILF